MEASMCIIPLVFAAVIVVGSVGGFTSVAADDVVGAESLVNRNETSVSETDRVTDREQLRRYLLRGR
jgi:hypothetical protein